jgi:hypothetical protein
VNAEHATLELGDLDDDKWMLAASQVAEIQELARDLELCLRDFSYHFPHVPRSITNRDSLPWNFIDILSEIYESMTGVAPAVSKSGPFVRLVAAAWEDVEFPSEDNDGEKRDDVQGWFGDRIEKQLLAHRKRNHK